MKAMTSEDKERKKKKRSSQKKHGSDKTKNLAILGLLTAITLILSFTPLGYIPIGPLKLTFMTIPVIVAAAILKPRDAAVIGGVFGLTSFIQAFSGMSLLTGALFQLNPLLTFLLCVVPRVLEGLLGGLLFQWLNKIDKTKFFSYSAVSLAVPVLNTILFMSALYLEIKIICSYNSAGSGLDGDFAKTFTGVSGKAAGDVLLFFTSMVGLQAITEAVVCFVLGTAITKALSAAINRNKK